MPYNNYNQSGVPQGGFPQSEKKKKEPAVNKCEFTGIVRPRGNYQEVKINQLPNGAASAKFTLDCREFLGQNDENGIPKMRSTFVPVTMWTNKNITVQQLQGIVPGMRMHIVGRWSNQHYKDRNGQERNFTEVEAYVLEVLDQPQPQYPQYPAQGMYGHPQVQQPQSPYGYPPAGAQRPSNPVPQYNANGRITPTAQPQEQPAQTRPQDGGGSGVPPYYVPAGGKQPQSNNDPGDLPEDINIRG